MSLNSFAEMILNTRLSSCVILPWLPQAADIIKDENHFTTRFDSYPFNV